MTKLEPAHRNTLTSQQDIAALEQHQRRLLYGGGAFLSLVILLIMAASIFLSLDDYKSDQLDDFYKAKLALDSAFIQRDVGYMRSLNMVEYAWKNKSDELIAKGEKALQDFESHDDQAVIQASSHAAPWLVLGSGVNAWPGEKTSKYLGLAEELSVISGTSITNRGKRTGTSAYFYDPSETIFAFGNALQGTDLDAAANRADRAALFSKLTSPHIDFNDQQTIKEMRQSNGGSLSFYGVGLPKIHTELGKNPSTGQPSIVGSLVAMDGDTPIGVFLIYEPTQPFIDQIRTVSQSVMTVVTNNGEVVFTTGSPESGRDTARSIQPLLVLQPTDKGVAKYRKYGMFFLAERINGTDWTLVRTYGWAEVLQGEAIPILVAIALAILLLTTLWLLLIRQDRSVFAPALARAERVYQSEELNRTMIETSPIGLCVIGLDDTVPLLQNDVVRGFAAAMTDTDVTLYRSVLREFAHAKQALDGRPDAREFELALPGQNGSGVRHLLVAAVPIIYQNRAALFSVFRDVTARNELQENLRRAREDSEQAKLAAESASQAKTAFVATMSHEIRTPLNGILGHLELLGRSKLEPSQRERLERIRFSADTLLNIISDVLDFSRIEAGQLDIDPVPFEIRPLIEQTALLYAPTAERKGLRLYYGVDADLKPSYIADVHRIRQVLNNLTSNAIKFTESGRVILRVRPVPPRDAEEARLRFEVIDTGIGMTEEQQAQVFQPFSQADASISRRFGGSGLGLTLCRQISELMGGEIGLQSTLSVGSAFSFEVPVIVDKKTPATNLQPLAKRKVALLSAALEWRTEIGTLLSGWGADVMSAALPSELDPEWVAKADALVFFGTWRAWTGDDEAPLIERAKCVVRAIVDGPLLPESRDGAEYISCYSSTALLAAILESESGGHHRIYQVAPDEPEKRANERKEIVLLVDDNPVNRELIQQQLETLGYKVDAAEDGVAALRLWRDDRYCMVLTDINMPNMNGYELAQQLRDRGVALPILAVTATALASEKLRCHQVGINDLLLKPLSLESLDEAMSRYLVAVAKSPSTPATPVKPAWASKFPAKVCRIFVESGTRDLDAIRDAARASDQDALLARIHSMKGALLMMGEQEVAGQCAALEKLINAHGIDAATTKLDGLDSDMRELLQRYAEVC